MFYTPAAERILSYVLFSKHRTVIYNNKIGLTYMCDRFLVYIMTFLNYTGYAASSNWIITKGTWKEPAILTLKYAYCLPFKRLRTGPPLGRSPPLPNIEQKCQLSSCSVLNV